ncbi:uncharacterized protein LOC143282821 [Babylonia areolata]|uniref:uncharacterized protein LOC143282821 n=1 Tax=Babylonia areolata TaxID=304850 RepID=UPI003FD10B00
MDRTRALQYFDQLGFMSIPLQRRYVSSNELVVEGDGMGSSILQVDNKTKAGPANTGSTVPVCVTCTCSRNLRSLALSPGPVHDPVDTDTSDKDISDSDCDSDAEELNLDKLLFLMARLRQRSSAQASHPTLVRLASCFSPPDSLTNQHIDKLMKLMACDHTVVRETCLKALGRLVALSRGGELVRRSDLVEKVMDLTLQDTSQLTTATRVMAMGVLDKLLNVEELNYDQIRQRLDREVYPSMLQCLGGTYPLEVKYAACCIVRSLARDAAFAARIKKGSLFLLEQLQESSTKLKEAYVGVLMAMFAHPGLKEVGSVDTGVLPVLKGLLQSGPCETQKQALELLQCVMSDDRGVEVVIGDQHLVTCVLACLLCSKCRKVRSQAGLVTVTLTSLHKMGMAHSVLEAIGQYVKLVESTETEEGGGKLQYPVPAKNRAESLLWHHLDAFLDSLHSLLCSEGLISTEEDQLHSELPLKGEVSGVQLSCLSHLMGVVVNVCTCPLQRKAMGLGKIQPARLDVTHLSDDSALREKYCTLNHRLAVQQWKRFGPSVFVVLRWMSHRLATQLDHTTTTTTTTTHTTTSNTVRARPPQTPPRPASSMSSRSSTSRITSRPTLAKSGSVMAREILTEVEVVLVQSLLNFVLCMTLVTCKRLTNPLGAEDDASPKPPPPPLPSGRGSSLKRTPEPCGLWVDSNPHLTHSSRQPVVTLEDMARKQQEDAEKEAVLDRRRVRRGLFNEGLFELLTPFLHLADPEVKTLCCLILRTSVQPLEERGVVWAAHGAQEMEGGDGGKSYSSFGHSLSALRSGDRRTHSEATIGSRKAEKSMNIALHCMSPATAAVVKDALGLCSQSACETVSEKVMTSAQRPGTKGTSVKDGVDGWTSNTTPSNTSSSRYQSWLGLRPLAPGQPINKECQRAAVVTCGSQAIQNLFCRSPSIKLCTLTFLYDLVRFSSVPVHMELSKCGIVPKLLDFIRVSEEEEQLEVLALRTLGLLTSSDLRLQQLFSHHGGHTLLMALTRNTNANIRDQVKVTLSTVTKGQRFGQGSKVPGQRPSSAPLNRRQSCPASVSSGPPQDIWEHIMQRWVQEDKVVEVLQKFK